MNHRAGFDERAQVAHLGGGRKEDPQPAACAGERRRSRARDGVRVAGVPGHPGPAEATASGQVDDQVAQRQARTDRQRAGQQARADVSEQDRRIAGHGIDVERRLPVAARHRHRRADAPQGHVVTRVGLDLDHCQRRRSRGRAGEAPRRNRPPGQWRLPRSLARPPSPTVRPSRSAPAPQPPGRAPVVALRSGCRPGRPAVRVGGVGRDRGRGRRPRSRSRRMVRSTGSRAGQPRASSLAGGGAWSRRQQAGTWPASSTASEPRNASTENGVDEQAGIDTRMGGASAAPAFAPASANAAATRIKTETRMPARIGPVIAFVTRRCFDLARPDTRGDRPPPPLAPPAGCPPARRPPRAASGHPRAGCAERRATARG